MLKKNVSFEGKYIPSKDVRRLIETEGWHFSDRDRATIIWNSTRSILEKLEDLKDILNYTKDFDLAEQIRERYDYDLRDQMVMPKMVKEILSIKKPTLKKTYKSPYTYTQSDIDIMNRKRMRTNEWGIMLFVL